MSLSSVRVRLKWSANAAPGMRSPESSLRRAWQRRFFLAREAEDRPVLMIHDSQVLSPDFDWEKLASEISGLNAGPK